MVDRRSGEDAFYRERKPIRGGEVAMLAVLGWNAIVGIYFLVDSGWGTPELYRVLVGMPIFLGVLGTVVFTFSGLGKTLVVDRRGVRVTWLARISADRVLDWRVVSRPSEDELYLEMWTMKIDGSRYHPFRCFLQWGDDTVVLIGDRRARIFTHLAFATADPEAFTQALERMVVARAD